MKMNKYLSDLSLNKIFNCIKSLNGFSFYKNPKVVYLVADNTPYKNSDGEYVLADSTTGISLLADTATYTSANLGLACYSSGGADSVTPFKKGTATADKVLSGYTFGNDTSCGISGTMTNNGGTAKSATFALDSTNSRVQATVPANAFYNTSSKIYVAYSTLANLIGLTAAKLVKGNTVLGIAGTGSAAKSVQSGSFAANLSNYGSYNKTITFSPAFSSAPTVIACSGFWRISCSVSNITATGFTISGSNNANSSQSGTIYWNATSQ